MLTWTRPARGSSRPSARTPGVTAASLADERGDLPRDLDIAAAEVDVEGDQRTPRADEHRTGSRVEPGGPKSGRELARVDAFLQLGDAAAAEERRASPGRELLPVQERRQPELLTDALGEPERGGARAGMSSWRIGTTGTTSAAPMHGWTPSCRSRSISSRARATPSTRAASSSSSAPTSVNTERLWSWSTWTSSSRACAESASPMASIGVRLPAPPRSSERLRAGAARAYSRAVKAYYDARAPEYDEWYEGTGLFSERDRPAWNELLDELAASLQALPPARTLDVACGTGYPRRWLPGEITGLDQSERMLEIAAGRLPDATFVRGDALDLPFPDGAFERVSTMSFYGHLEEPTGTASSPRRDGSPTSS